MKRTSPIAFRIDPDLEARLKEVATETGIPKYTLAKWALDAVVEAAERNGYQLVVPVKFTAIKQGVGKDAPDKLVPTNVPLCDHPTGDDGQRAPHRYDTESQNQPLQPKKTKRPRKVKRPANESDQ